MMYVAGNILPFGLDVVENLKGNMNYKKFDPLNWNCDNIMLKFF